MPPRKHFPSPVTDLVARARGGQVILMWTIPSRNVDGTAFRDLVRFDVFRRAEEAKQKRRGFWSRLVGRKAGRFEQIGSVRGQGVEAGGPAGGKMVRFLDTGLGISTREEWFGRTFEYYVVAVGRRWRKSPPSNQAKAMPLLGPRPPENVKAQPGDRKVVIAWSAQNRLVDGRPVRARVLYNVYRVPTEGWPLVGPLNKTALAVCKYSDGPVKNDREYCYAVTAVAVSGAIKAESATSVTVCARPEDHTAPPPPFGLEAVGGQGQISLIWSGKEVADLLGYNVYRRKSGEKEFLLLTARPIGRTTFVDRAVFPGVGYTYYVTAVDNSRFANESQPSNLASARAR